MFFYRQFISRTLGLSLLVLTSMTQPAFCEGRTPEHPKVASHPIPNEDIHHLVSITDKIRDRHPILQM